MDGLLLNLNGAEYVEKTIEDNIKDRRIIINNEINAALIESAVLQIFKFNQEDRALPKDKRKPIYIYINCIGGEVPNGFALIDAIRCSNTPVYGVVLGYAYSMGALILIACHKRFALENASILFHDGTQGAVSTGSKFKDIVKFYDEMDARIKQLVLDTTKINSDFYDEKYEKEFYFYASEGKNLGVVDYILGQDVELEEIL